MPYFSWKGVNLYARTCKGTQFAANEYELDATLFKKDIALLSHKPKKILWYWSISLQTKIDYFMQLGMLIKAGVLLPDALQLVAQQSAQGNFAAIAYDVADKVRQGISLPNALAKHSITFDPLMIQIAAVGQESGSLAAALQVLTAHLESVASFRARLKAALVLPAVTFVFFLVIIGIMLIVIVPQFAALFASMHKDLPGGTKLMVMGSNFLRSWYLVATGVLCIGLYYCIRRYMKTQEGKQLGQRISLRIPGINRMVINKNMAGFFQSIALLLHGGMPLVKAITIAKESIDNYLIKSQIHTIEKEINAGDSFASSLASYEHLCAQDMICLIKIGQESGMLADMLVRVSLHYQQRLLRILSRINTLFQPFLLIILGLLITGLILALYTPIMNLSYAV